ncbi:MAG TPA: FHA domain-containing protein [Povalibacter sp.]
MSKQIRVLRGLHSGAELELERGAPLTIGSDTSCSVVLCDGGVTARHCVITTDDYGVTCRALEGSIRLGEQTIHPGHAVALDDFNVFHCGRVAIGVGPADQSASSRWLQLEQTAQTPAPARFAAAHALKRMNPYALFGTVLAGIGGVISLAYATLSADSQQLTPTRIEAARQWLQSVAPAGSELSIGSSGLQVLVLSGYVRSGEQRDALLTAAQRSSFDPRVDVYAADQLLESLSRLIRLEGLKCEPQYRSAGQVACAQTVPSETMASALRRVARDVPGVTSIEVAVEQSPAPTPQLAVRPDEPAAAPSQPLLTRKFSVLMYRQKRYLVGQFGDRYTEGDTFDGLRINRIEVDEVTFERDGREYPFRVAALGSRH